MNTYTLEMEVGSPTYTEIYKGLSVRVYHYYWSVVEDNGNVLWVSEKFQDLDSCLSCSRSWIDLRGIE